MADKPTVAEIRSWTQVPITRYGYSDDGKLQAVIDRATGYVLWVTGQRFPDLDTSSSMAGDASMLDPMMDQAIQMRVEQVILQGRPGYVGSAAEMDVIAGFSASGYSETRVQGGFSSRSGAAEKSINKWPSLEELLWMLMTPERYSYWLAFVSGQVEPDFAVIEVDWRGLGTAVSFFEPWDRFAMSDGGGAGSL